MMMTTTREAKESIYSKESGNLGMASGEAVVAGDNQIPLFLNSLDKKEEFIPFLRRALEARLL